ncbi:MAG: hypothetical protein QOH60_3312 [Mycobacterium sp.]|nr:hypothetical protein [Mycobacterium sp.]
MGPSHTSYSSNSPWVFAAVIGVILIVFTISAVFAIRRWIRIARIAREALTEGRRAHDSGEPVRPPGWYEDPVDTTLMRYFDGKSWTQTTAPRQ